VDAFVARFRLVKCFHERFNLSQLLVLDRKVDPHNVLFPSESFRELLFWHLNCPERPSNPNLVDYSTCSNVQVTDFRVAHQTLGKTNEQAVCLELRHRVGVLFGETGHDRVLRVPNRVASGIFFSRDAPAIDAD
jgi:hypothetical protein